MELWMSVGAELVLLWEMALTVSYIMACIEAPFVLMWIGPFLRIWGSCRHECNIVALDEGFCNHSVFFTCNSMIIFASCKSKRSIETFKYGKFLKILFSWCSRCEYKTLWSTTTQHLFMIFIVDKRKMKQLKNKFGVWKSVNSRIKSKGSEFQVEGNIRPVTFR
jgi:hypothetical protein